MKIVRLKNITYTEKLRIFKRSAETSTEISQIVQKIIEDVCLNKDKALEKYIKKFNKVELTDLKVSKEEIEQAYQEVDQSFLDALKQARKNISIFTKSQLKQTEPRIITTEEGIKLWRVWRPIEKVGLYIPGGKAVYPSSVLMTGILAKNAGCKEIILCSPVNNKGQIPAPILVAVDTVGINKIYKVGGAEAIAAMAYGTESIPKVYKIFGAGNSFVTEAKMQVFGKVNIDMPAGPSEIFIIADETANPAFVAADLLADGEHAEDSACVLLTTSKRLAEQVKLEINKQLKTLFTSQRIKQALKNYGFLIVTDSLDEAIEFCNEYAPEHLEIMTKDPEKALSKITNAGSVFLGNWSSKSAGDYATGANHVLPTSGFAKMFSPLSIESFGKMMEVQKVESKKALSLIRDTIETFGEIEQLPAHKNATSIRFKS